MTNNLDYGKVSSRHLIASVLAGATLLLAVPALSAAATYAYVNQAGEVRTVEASNPDSAMATAAGIDEHSGVLLIDSAADQEVVGDTVIVQ